METRKLIKARKVELEGLNPVVAFTEPARWGLREINMLWRSGVVNIRGDDGMLARADGRTLMMEEICNRGLLPDMTNKWSAPLELALLLLLQERYEEVVDEDHGKYLKDADAGMTCSAAVFIDELICSRDHPILLPLVVEQLIRHMGDGYGTLVFGNDPALERCAFQEMGAFWIYNADNTNPAFEAAWDGHVWEPPKAQPITAEKHFQNLLNYYRDDIYDLAYDRVAVGMFLGNVVRGLVEGVEWSEDLPQDAMISVTRSWLRVNGNFDQRWKREVVVDFISFCFNGEVISVEELQ